MQVSPPYADEHNRHQRQPQRQADPKPHDAVPEAKRDEGGKRQANQPVADEICRHRGARVS